MERIMTCPMTILMLMCSVPLANSGRFAPGRNRDERADRAGIWGQILAGYSLHILNCDATYPFKKFIDVPPTGADRLGLTEYHGLPKVGVLAKKIFGFHLIFRPLKLLLGGRTVLDSFKFSVQSLFDVFNF